MEKIICPYCHSEMDFVKNFGLGKVKAYYHCKNCFARSPRVWVEYIEDEMDRPTIPHKSDDVPTSSILVEEKAYIAAIGQCEPANYDLHIDNIFAVCDEDIDSGLKL